MTRRLNLRLILLFALLAGLVSVIGSQIQAATTQQCLLCRYRCGVARTDCYDRGLPAEACEADFNECVEGCVTAGLCPPG